MNRFQSGSRKSERWYTAANMAQRDLSLNGSNSAKLLKWPLFGRDPIFILNILNKLGMSCPYFDDDVEIPFNHCEGSARLLWLLYHLLSGQHNYTCYLVNYYWNLFGGNYNWCNYIKNYTTATNRVSFNQTFRLDCSTVYYIDFIYSLGWGRHLSRKMCQKTASTSKTNSNRGY